MGRPNGHGTEPHVSRARQRGNAAGTQAAKSQRKSSTPDGVARAVCDAWLLSVCLGLRISEALGLQWGHVDWLGSRPTIRRGIVNQRVDDVKTVGSARTFDVTPALLARLQTARQRVVSSDAEGWIFASPIRLGRLPYSYTGICRQIQRAATAAGLGHLGTHTFRHTYRWWLDAMGTAVAVQQKMMRHADIRTTFNIYGDVVTDEMTTAGIKVSQIAFPEMERNRSYF